jgi:hypothetical protein
MPTYAKLRTDAVTFGNAVDPDSVPDNSLILDQNSGNVSTKESGGSSSVGSGATSQKTMQSATAIPDKTPVSKGSDGKIVIADADAILGQKVIGVTAEAFAGPDSIGAVTIYGVNVPGLLTGLGFQPGDEIYQSATPGSFTNDVESFDVETASIIFMGYADCGAGAASGIATDLIMAVEVISRPSV